MGNRRGKNKGKKYIKLQGHEQPTPETKKRADHFMEWYGANFDKIRDELIYASLYDDGLATDTALHLYECIALKAFIIKDYKFYYLRSYHTARISAAKKKRYDVRLDDDQTLLQLEACGYDYDKYERIVAQLNAEIFKYVRENYDPIAVSLFEIYIGLSPDTSYKRLSVMLDIPVTLIWTNLGAIRKDVREKFVKRKDFMLSLLK